MKLALIGLGKMGTALLQGLIRGSLDRTEEITGCDPLVEDSDSNERYFNIKTRKDNLAGVRDADIIILAVKPQLMSEVLAGIADYTDGKLIISIAAGIAIEKIKSRVADTARVVRVMPNTPALIGEGMSAFCTGGGISESDRKIVAEILQSVGEAVEVEESLMDAVTGLSGSGPAYVYLIIEALADGGVLMGLARETAQKLAVQTVLGSARMVLETGKHPGELKDAVTSPAGTTIRALEILEEKGLRSALIEAVKAAAERSRELNNM